MLKTKAYHHRNKGLGLTFVRGSGWDLPAYSDANYAYKATTDARSYVGQVAPGLCDVLNRGRVRGPKRTGDTALFTDTMSSFIFPERHGLCIRVYEDGQRATASYSYLYFFGCSIYRGYAPVVFRCK